MRATREDPRRSIDFGAVRDPEAIHRAIIALLKRRKNPMREREIQRWFRATPKKAIGEALMFLAWRGDVDTGRTSMNRNRCVLEYTEKGTTIQ